MEQIYFRNKKNCELKKSSTQTVRFLLDFSKSLHIVNYNSFKFESSLN